MTSPSSDPLPSRTDLIDLLRRIPEPAWVEVVEPNGWSYHTNIGQLVHRAADEILMLRRALSLSVVVDRDSGDETTPNKE